MSAYVCNPTHIALLAIKTAAWTKTWGDAKKVASILAKENLRSVEARYNDVPEAAQDFLGIGNQEYIDECVKLTSDPNIEFHPLTFPRIFGMARCTGYQSCETDDYETTEAAAILRYLQLSAAHKSFEQSKLECGWEFDPSEIKTRNIQRLF